ncbi:MAG: YjbQ family protein [Chlorobiaceae bacterium]|nr:YjbQ family protein [Chlorobiaceae bacterium]NTW10119.1 YjbQ family protein [Chlorobiaceae bacterium]
MQFIINNISLRTTKPLEIVDITAEAEAAVAASGIGNGLLNVMSRHTTAFIAINEKEESLLEDMETFLKRFVPRDGNYRHNLTSLDGRDNAHSHLLGLFMNASETIPIADGRLLLGEWQSLFFIELDGPRDRRNVLLQISGI